MSAGAAAPPHHAAASQQGSVASAAGVGTTAGAFVGLPGTGSNALGPRATPRGDGASTRSRALARGTSHHPAQPLASGAWSSPQRRSSNLRRNARGRCDALSTPLRWILSGTLGVSSSRLCVADLSRAGATAPSADATIGPDRAVSSLACDGPRGPGAHDGLIADGLSVPWLMAWSAPA